MTTSECHGSVRIPAESQESLLATCTEQKVEKGQADFSGTTSVSECGVPHCGIDT